MDCTPPEDGPALLKQTPSEGANADENGQEPRSLHQYAPNMHPQRDLMFNSTWHSSATCSLLDVGSALKKDDDPGT